MSSKKDYYEILGISRDADPGEIKKAYRKAALKFHPDKTPGDQKAEDRFKEAAEAYLVLSDAEKRRQFDQFGHEGGGVGVGCGHYSFCSPGVATTRATPAREPTPRRTSLRSAYR